MQKHLFSDHFYNTLSVESSFCLYIFPVFPISFANVLSNINHGFMNFSTTLDLSSTFNILFLIYKIRKEMCVCVFKKNKKQVICIRQAFLILLSVLSRFCYGTLLWLKLSLMKSAPYKVCFELLS